MEEDEPGANRSRLTDEWSATMTATMTEVTTLSRLPTMMDRNPACMDISLEGFDRGHARGYGCKDSN